jgi:hypothetical protein
MCVLCQVEYLLGTYCPEQYALIETSRKKWQKNANGLEDDEYELPVSQYNANKDTLVVEKKGNIMEEGLETKTPSTLESKNGEN